MGSEPRRELTAAEQAETWHAATLSVLADLKAARGEADALREALRPLVEHELLGQDRTTDDMLCVLCGGGWERDPEGWGGRYVHADECEWLRARAALAPSEAPTPETVHACPPDDAAVTPCCGRSPFELPLTDRITLDPELVTCGGAPTRERPTCPDCGAVCRGSAGYSIHRGRCRASEAEGPAE